MRIGIVGPGSMGCFIAATLKYSGNDVFLVDYKSDRAEKLNESGITLSDEKGRFNVKVPVVADPLEIGNVDGLVFMVKAYSTYDAASRIAAVAKNDLWVLSMQNGMGNVEILSNIFGEDKVIAGSTSQGANLREFNFVNHAGRGETLIGEISGERSDRVNRIAAMFTNSGIPAMATENVNGLLWTKLIINVGINPITALLRIKNGEIFNKPSAYELMRSAVIEAETVSKLKKVKLETPNILITVDEVIRRTSDNVSSMLQDVMKGNMTEIEYMSGYVNRQGNIVGIQTPVNQTLLRLVRAINENERVEEDEWAIDVELNTN